MERLGRFLLVFAALALFQVGSAPLARGQATSTVNVTMFFPAGVDRLTSVLNANGTLRVNDRAVVQGASGEPAEISNAGTLETNIGVQAVVGTLTSVAPVALRNNCTVGNLLTGASISEQSGVKVLGVRSDDAELSPLTSREFTVTFPSSAGSSVQLEPGQTRTLSPGDYATVSIKQNAVLNLSSGEYKFRRLELNDGGTISIDAGGGPVLVQVRDGATFHGRAISASADSAPDWTLIYTGTSEVGVNKQFNGALIAPNAKINLFSSKLHTGWFYGKDIELHPDSELVAQPGSHVCLPGMVCEVIPEPPTTRDVDLPDPIASDYSQQGGALDWSFDVTPQGQAVYSIPIDVPPGPGGVQPNLSLVYRSVRRNGVLGVGWAVEGLSGIHVCPRTSGSDTTPGPILDAPDDRFCLDGQRLVAVSGTYGADGTEYRTEMESFAQVLSHGGNPVAGSAYQTPEKFVVRHKDGRILTYGGTENSVDAHGGVRRLWALSSVEDRSGNLMSVKYRRSFVTVSNVGQLMPLSLSYGGNTNDEVEHNREVVFEYHVGPDLALYSAGARRVTAERLIHVVTRVDGEDVKDYAFDYGDDVLERATTGRALYLESVTLCAAASGGSQCAAPTLFEYWDLPRFSLEREASNVQPGDGFGNGVPSSDIGRTVVLDVNGDGFDDLFYPAFVGFEPEGVPNYHYHVALSTGLGGDDAGPYFEDPVDTGLHASSNDLRPGGVPYYCVSSQNVLDYNGDGNDDIFDQCNGLVLLSNGTSYDHDHVELVNVIPLADEDEEDSLRVFGTSTHAADVTGDGLTDLLTCVPEDGVAPDGYGLHHYRLFENPGAGLEFNVETWRELPGIGPGCRHTPLFIDTDGDGIVNLLQRTRDPHVDPTAGLDVEWRALRISDSDAQWVDTGLVLRELDHDSPIDFDDPDWSLEVFGPRLNDMTAIPYARAWQLKTLDMNGDGLTDLLHYRGDLEGSERLTVWANTGAGFEYVGSPSPSEPFISRFAFQRAQVLDYDGDGRQDLLVPTGPSNPGTTLKWYLFRTRGGLTGGFSFDFAEEVASYSLYDGSSPVVGDFDADGSADLALMDTAEPYGVKVVYGHHAQAGLLTAAYDGLGKGVRIAYDSKFAYTKGNCTVDERRVTHCVDRMPPLVSAVSETKRRNGSGGLEDLAPIQITQLYTYRDARIGLHQRGWLGFAERTRTTQWLDGVDRVRQTWTYDNDTFLESVSGSSTSRIYPFAGVATSHETEYPQVGRLSSVQFDEPELRLSDAELPFVHVPGRTTTELSSVSPYRTVEVETAVDEYGNLELETTRTRGRQGDLISEDVVDRDFTPTTAERDAWLVNLPKGQIVSSNALGLSSVRTTSYTYDDRGRLESVKKEPIHPAVTVGSTIGRHPISGHVTSIRHVAAIGGTRTQSVEYDERGMFPVRHVDANGFATSVLHHPAHGGLWVAADPNGIISRWGYDGLGREVVHETPSGRRITNYHREHALIDDSVYGRMVVEVLTEGGETVETLLDAYRRPVLTRTTGIEGARVFQETNYDFAGRVTSRARPHLEGDSTQGLISYEYDDLGRLRFETHPNGAVYERRYLSAAELDRSGFTSQTEREASEAVVLIDPMGDEDTAVIGARGTGVASIDAAGSLNQYEYGPFNVLREILDTYGNVTDIVADAYGRVTTRIDPDSGEHAYTYNGFDEVLTHQDAEGDVQQFSYDALGRRVLVVDGDGTVTRLRYDVGENAIGRLVESNRTGGARTTYAFEPFAEANRGLIETVTQEVAGTVSTVEFGYTHFGQLVTIRYPEAAGEEFAVVQTYDDYGHLLRVSDASTDSTYWELETADQGYRIGTERFGNDAVTTTTYVEATGRVHSIETLSSGDALQDIEHRYRSDNHLEWRIDHRDSDGSRFYDYDPRKRLTDVHGVDGTGSDVDPGGVLTSAAYDDLGNITSRTGVGSYDYDPPGTGSPHAVRTAGDNDFDYDANGRQTMRAGPDVAGGAQYIDYNAFDLPTAVRSTPDGDPIATFRYDANGQRVFAEANGTNTVYFASLYERTSDGEADGEREHRYRIHAAGRQVAQVTRYELADEITEEAVQYLHSDALGSPEVITDETGDLVDRRAFDPFGKLEAGDLPGTPSVSTGFTGHEHDTELGWINMGGRIYDPTVARFLTPDPIIQAPYSSQGLNAYSYVFNNPLNFTDPTGFQAINEFGQIEVTVCGSNRPAECKDWGKQTSNTSSWYSPEAFGIGALGPPQAPRQPVAETLPVPRSVGQQFADLTVEVLGGIAQGVVCGLLGCGEANAPIKGQPTASAMSEGEKLMNSAFTAAGVVGIGVLGRAPPTPARAGSGLGPWVPASGVTSGGAVAQSLPGSCGAACVEMLTGGAISEAAAIGR